MRILIARYASVMALAVFSAAASGPQRISDLSFTAPRGWSQREVNELQMVLQAPGNAGDEFTSIVLALCPQLPGTFPAQFQSAVSGVLAGKRIVEASDVHHALSLQDSEVLTQRLLVTETAGRKVATMFAGLRAGAGLLLIGMLASDAARISAQQSTFTGFVDSVRMQAPAEGSPMPTAAIPAAGSIAKPGVVAGTIYDAHGRPFRIPGARVVVHIWGAGAGGDRVGFDIPVDASGHYESRVPHGLYGFHARAWLPLNGETVCVDLEPLDGRATETALDSTPGIVRDFGLRLTGPVAGADTRTIQGFYGGSLTVTDGANWKSPVFGAMSRRYPAGTKVVVWLQPIGPAIDGSSPPPVRYEYDLQKIQNGEHKVNIVLAAYRATAVLVTPDGRQHPLRVALLPDLSYGNSVDVLYRPDRDDHDGRAARPSLFVLD